MIEVVICHTGIAVVSGIFSYIVSFFTTRECISYYKKKSYDNNPNVNLNNLYRELSSYESKTPKKTTIKFSDQVHFLVIPNISEISDHEKEMIWYSQQEYRKFKDDIILNGF